MELDKKGFSLAAAGTFGIVYVICSAFVAIAPEAARQLLGWLAHLVNVGDVKITFGGFLAGLLQVLIYTYIIAWVFAWLHNRYATMKK